MSRLDKNRSFLSNIYRKGSFQGHAFLCNPRLDSICDAEGKDYTLSGRPVRELSPRFAEEYQRKLAFWEEVGDDSVPVVRLTTGTHIYAAAFGCPVHTYPDNNPCAMPLVQTAEEADLLQIPDIWKVPVLYRIFEMAHQLQRELGKEAILGPPDMQTGFDTACLVWNKSELYVNFLDVAGRDAVKRLAAKCAQLFRTFLYEFRKEFPASSPCHCPNAWAPPEQGPWASNDECGAFGTELFEELCLPEMIELSRTFGSFGMHCCADAEHQFPSFKKIPGFYAFNRVAGRRGYKPLLEHFSGPSSPVFVLGWIEDPAIEELLYGGDAHARFIFVRDDLNVEEARLWLEKMRTLSPRID